MRWFSIQWCLDCDSKVHSAHNEEWCECLDNEVEKEVPEVLMIPTSKRSYKWKNRAKCKCGNPKSRPEYKMCARCTRLSRKE